MEQIDQEIQALPDMSYAQAIRELESIVSAIEGGQMDVDQLGAGVRRGALLARLCRAKLTAADDEVKRVLEMLSDARDEGAGNDLP